MYCYMCKNGATIRVARKFASQKLREGFLFSTREEFMRTLDKNWDTHIFLRPTRQHLQDALI